MILMEVVLPLQSGREMKFAKIATKHEFMYSGDGLFGDMYSSL